MERIYLSPPHMSELERKYVQQAFDSNWVAPLGPMVDAFEEEIAEYVGVPYAAGVSSGTAAIHLGLRLLGVEPGDSVLCSSLTFVASANPILYLGARPVFIDSDPVTGNMSVEALTRALKTFETRGILPKAAVTVDLYGQACEYDKILPLLRSRGIGVLEDAAEALGGRYRGQQCGTFGDVSILSFNGNKIVNTSGGGMVLCRTREAKEKVIYWSTQAKDPAPHYEHSELGYNYRMSNILAAIGRGQLAWLDERIAVKRRLYQRYHETLGELPGVRFWGDPPLGENTRWLIVMFVDPRKSPVSRDRILAQLAEENIEARPVWKPLHAQRLFEGCEYFAHSSALNVSEYFFETGICLPCGSNMTAAQQNRVIQSVQKVFEISREARHRL